jgi:uncharacterized Ntn-hydrolase superfamily protein
VTISILAHDDAAGLHGGAAATGNLCVGGWVLRGDARSGVSASQGTFPSTLWGEDVLQLMREGRPAAAAVAEVTGPDPGRGHRQLSAIDPAGGTGAFTGAESVAVAATRAARHVVVAGNMLASGAVLDAALRGFLDADGPLDIRLLAALDAAAAAGGDSRGLMSAALLVVGRGIAPMSLRIDLSDAPLAALRALHARASSGDYAAWAAGLPTLDDPWGAAG